MAENIDVKEVSKMLGELKDNEIEKLLKTQHTGRIGCYADGEVYIVPINYHYHEGNVYAHSGEGLKIDKMRKNPAVCFQVDDIVDLSNWQSVVAWGDFCEITDIEGKEHAMQLLIDAIMPQIKAENGHPSHGITENDSDIGTSVELVIYKLVLTKKTGRFEKNE